MDTVKPYLKSDVQLSWMPPGAVAQGPIYSDPAYQNLISAYDQSSASVLQINSESRGVTTLPLLVRDLGGGLREAYSAYGYGGLVGEWALHTADVIQIQRFLAGEGIVAVFLRHSPFLRNQCQWPTDVVELNRRTYASELVVHADFDALLCQRPQKLRWSVNHARRAGLVVSFMPLTPPCGDAILNFYTLYATLMRQKQTAPYYRFSPEFFLDHARALGQRCELVQLRNAGTGELVGGAFFLLDATGWVHYHLSAATAAAMKLQGMELLMASALHRYGTQGYHHLHLGGGHQLDESDGLSRFKAKFADQKLDFCCTKLLTDPALYSHERKRLPLNHPHLFLIADARAA